MTQIKNCVKASDLRWSQRQGSGKKEAEKREEGWFAKVEISQIFVDLILELNDVFWEISNSGFLWSLWNFMTQNKAVNESAEWRSGMKGSRKWMLKIKFKSLQQNLGDYYLWLLEGVQKRGDSRVNVSAFRNEIWSHKHGDNADDDGWLFNYNFRFLLSESLHAFLLVSIPLWKKHGLT